MEELNENLGNVNILYRFFKLREGIDFVLGVLERLWVLLVPALRPLSGVLLEADRDFGDPETIFLS